MPGTWHLAWHAWHLALALALALAPGTWSWCFIDALLRTARALGQHVILALLLGLHLALLLACSSSSPLTPTLTPGVAPAPAPRPTVVLVSLDTTRADAISATTEVSWHPELPAAQRPVPSTPTVDALAARGTRFAWALAQAPTTLSSHTTAMSGLDPHQHQVVRNGFPVPDDVPLLAERLQAAGYDTVAAVGSSALERDMGLSRGFRIYEDHAANAPRSDYMVRATQVTTSALAAVDRRQTDKPLLVFAHYYDAHMPWVAAPPDVRARFVDPAYQGNIDGGPDSIATLTRARLSGRMLLADARQARALYLAEVAYADDQLGRLLSGLRDRGLMQDSLVVLMADHGELLDEGATHPYSHGADVDLPATHVPLILAGTGSMAAPTPQPTDRALATGVPAGLVIDRQVRLQDLAPTVLGLLDLPTIGTGEDLGPLLHGGHPPAPPALAEATRPPGLERADAWNNLDMERGVFHDGALLVRSPTAHTDTLYSLAPGQPLVSSSPAADQTQAALGQLLDDWDQAAPAHRDVQMSKQTTQGLRALGYVE